MLSKKLPLKFIKLCYHTYSPEIEKEKYEDLISKLNSYSLKEITDEKYKGWQYLIKIEKKGGEIILICFMDNKVKVNDIVYEVRDYNIDDFSYLFE